MLKGKSELYTLELGVSSIAKIAIEGVCELVFLSPAQGESDVSEVWQSAPTDALCPLGGAFNDLERKKKASSRKRTFFD